MFVLSCRKWANDKGKCCEHCKHWTAAAAAATAAAKAASKQLANKLMMPRLQQQ